LKGEEKKKKKKKEPAKRGEEEREQQTEEEGEKDSVSLSCGTSPNSLGGTGRRDRGGGEGVP